MGKGQEYVRRVAEALKVFEQAVVRREHKTPLESKVPLQQAVDRAREELKQVIAEVVAQERIRAEKP